MILRSLWHRSHVSIVEITWAHMQPLHPSPLSPPHLQYQRARKKQQRVERQQQKDMERDAQRKSVRYTLRVQDVLNGMDDEAKENFRSGANGAVVSCPTGIFLKGTSWTKIHSHAPERS